ncbi:MAG: hypothetical protein IAE99_08230 [Rhodothermales bacterium]|nr:hypothetical protein [Rhodothermales bacterium]
MTRQEVPDWFASNGLRLLFGLLMATLGWYITTTLSEIKGNIRETNQGVQVLMQNREATNARLEMLDQLAQRNADRLRELEREAWQARASNRP